MREKVKHSATTAKPYKNNPKKNRVFTFDATPPHVDVETLTIKPKTSPPPFPHPVQLEVLQLEREGYGASLHLITLTKNRSTKGGGSPNPVRGLLVRGASGGDFLDL